jgi:ElaA protein
MGLSLHKKRFDELTTQELYELLRIRTDVEDLIVALCRVCPAGTHMEEVSIGLKDS